MGAETRRVVRCGRRAALCLALALAGCGSSGKAPTAQGGTDGGASSDGAGAEVPTDAGAVETGPSNFVDAGCFQSPDQLCGPGVFWICERTDCPEGTATLDDPIYTPPAGWVYCCGP